MARRQAKWRAVVDEADEGNLNAVACSRQNAAPGSRGRGPLATHTAVAVATSAGLTGGQKSRERIKKARKMFI